MKDQQTKKYYGFFPYVNTPPRKYTVGYRDSETN